MKAAVLYEPRSRIRVDELDLDEPETGEVRVKMVSAGVCRSDYHRLTADTVPLLLGHEGAGIVQRVGPGVRDLAPGDHVIFSVTPQCGRCRYCASGRPNICVGYPTGFRRGPGNMSRFSVNGRYCYHTLAAFSEETVVLADAAVKVREDAPLDRACLIGCAVATGVCVVLNRARVEAGSTVAVFGCGGVGLNAVQGAVLAGASKIVAVDRVDFKLEKAEEMGATHFVNADREDPVRRVREITGGGADYAFDVIGLLEVLRQAFESLGPGGTAVTVGLGEDLSLPSGPLGQDRTIMGTYYGAARPRTDFHWLLDMYMDGRLKVDELITRYRPLDEVNEAFDDMNAGVTARTVLTFG